MLLDLLRTGGRQTLDKVDPAWRLEVGEFSIAVLEQCVCRDTGVLRFGQHYACKHFLFAEFVRHGNNRDLLHHVVRLQNCLDFGGKVLGAIGNGMGIGHGQFVEASYWVFDKQDNLYAGDTSVGRITKMVAPTK